MATTKFSLLSVLKLLPLVNDLQPWTSESLVKYKCMNRHRRKFHLEKLRHCFSSSLISFWPFTLCTYFTKMLNMFCIPIKIYNMTCTLYQQFFVFYFVAFWSMIVYISKMLRCTYGVWSVIELRDFAHLIWCIESKKDDVIFVCAQKGLMVIYARLNNI